VTYAYTATERKRVSFGKIPEAMELPNLISVQRESFERFKDEGLREAFKESSPIQSQNHVLEVTFGEHQFGDPAHTVEECREKDMTYQAPLLTDVRLTNKETGEIKEQLVFMGDFPMMTDQGTFIINGTERIVVSQLVRSPGVYYSSEMDSGKQIYKAQIIPSRGAWLEFEVDKRDQLMVSIDRKRKQSATMFLRALGIAVTNDDEANIMSAMLAKRMGAKKVMVLIQRKAYVDLVQGSVIDIAISPQQATISALLSHVRKADIVGVSSLRRGVAEAIEAVAHGDESTSRVVGRAIDEIKLPPGTIIGAVVRGNDVMIANNNLRIEQGDHVIMFLTDKKFISDVERLFQPSPFFL
jgi:DNA-directed RNA polymerase beta subunit